MTSSDAETHTTRAIDRFEIRGRLGAGAMGVVLEAYDRVRKQVIALKTLPNSEANALYRFKREFRTLADISHPNLVNLYDLFVEPEHAFFTMEKVDGTSFLSYVRPESEIGELETLHGAESVAPVSAPVSRGTDRSAEAANLRTGSVGASGTDLHALDTILGSLSAPGSLGSVTAAEAPVRASGGGGASGAIDEGRLRDALRQLALGVSAIHAAGKLHRDLKPSNVMVTGEGRLVILDFGLATELQAQEGGEGLSGTAAYMAPEQVDGHTVPASDWYAVGVMLFEALTGRRPFVGSLIQVLMDKRTHDAPSVRAMAPGAPADLAALCERLLARDPAGRPEAAEILRVFGGEAPVLAAPSELGAEALVGREPHLASLRAALGAVAGGEGVAVYVHGPSGTGKSALVRAFLAEARRSPQTALLASRCYLHESVPYKALDGVVDSLSRLLLGMPPEEARVLLPRDLWALARLFPVMTTVLEEFSDREPPRVAFDRLEVRRKAFTALRELLARLGDRRRVIVYIDDLQWADADSAILLDDLLRPPDAPPILLLATFRSEEIEGRPFLGELLARVDARARRQVAVAPLSDAEIRALIVRLIGDAAVARPFVPSIVREAAGSPFLAEQLALHVLQGQDAAATGVGLGEMISARLDAQPSGARALVSALAVAAHPLPSEVAAAAAAVGGDERPLVKSLLNARLLRVSGAEERLELYHDRLRETVYAGLGPAAVRDFHSRIAAAMERSGLDDPEALFGHYRGAGAREQAAVFADRAATKAIEALAFDQAAHFYQAALELAPEGPEAATSVHASRLGRARLERGLGDAFANAGRSREAAQAYLRAAALVDATRATELRRAAAEQLVCSGHLDEGRQVLGELLARADLPMAPSPKRALLSLVARRLQIKLRGYGYKERPEAEVPAEKLHRIDVCWAASSGLSMIDNIRGADYSARGLLLALDAGEPVRVANSMSMEAAFLASGGGSNRALAFKLSAQAIELARRTQSPAALAQVMMTAAACAYVSGLWRKAIDHASEADVMLRERCPGAIWQKATTQRFGFGALMYAGETGELRRRLPFALRDAEERGNLYSYADLSARLFMYWLAADDAEGHRRALADVFARWTNQGYHIQHFNALRSLLHGDLYEGAYDRAAARLAEQTPALEGSMLSRVQLVRGETLQLRAQIPLARLAAGEVAASERKGTLKAIDKELAALRGEKEPWCVALAALLGAGLIHQRGDAEAGRAALEASIRALRGAEMALHVAAAERTLGLVEGGEAGAARVRGADAWMRAQAIERPDRVAQALVSGFLPPL